jgi:hypothetical protein
MANHRYHTDNTLVEWADSDALWGPLLFLRPKRTEHLGPGRIGVIACVLGCVQGLAVNFVVATANRFVGQASAPGYEISIALSLALAVALDLSVGRAWNRRVDRLQRRQEWLANNAR